MAAAWLLLLLALLTAGGSSADHSNRRRPEPVTEETLLEVANSLEMFVDELPQIPKIYGYKTNADVSVSPGELEIGMYMKKWKFHRDLPPTTVFVYGTSRREATFPGPTIEVLKGTQLTVTWKNHLPRRHILPVDHTIGADIPRDGVPTVVHLHGGTTEPQSDGHPGAWFTAGFRRTGPYWSKQTYNYTNAQHPGTLWYHDHALGLTRANLLAGLVGGGYIVRDPSVEFPLGLPSGDDLDRLLVVADRSFLRDGSLYMNSTGNNPSIHPEWQPEYFGDAITVNGKAWPYLRVQRRRYRFRIINTCNARFLGLSLSSGHPFVVVASDSAYLPSPSTASSILVSPAESFTVVIDFSQTSDAHIDLTNYAPYPYPDGDTPDKARGTVMRFVVEPGHISDDSKLPEKLPQYPYASSPVTTTRYITLFDYESSTGEPTHLYINGKSPMDPATETPRPGTTEVWEVINLTEVNHPLHIHLAGFVAVSVRGIVGEDEFKECMRKKNFNAVACGVDRHAVGKTVEVPEHERTWKNIVKIAPGHVTTVVVTFRRLDSGEPYPFDATAAPGYVYHCHILDHEDNAMMRPLKLIS